MNLIKIGNFLTELRKERNMTQEELGDKLGVTNKTISRWENGNYLPSIEMLEALSNIYDLTINELISGKKLSKEEYKDMAETNIKETLQASTYELKNKINTLKKKWLKKHILIIILIIIVFLIIFITGFVIRESLVGLIALLFLIISINSINNKMMKYVENNTCDSLIK